jgi:hypothetical protein
LFFARQDPAAVLNHVVDNVDFQRLYCAVTAHKQCVRLADTADVVYVTTWVV